MGAQTSGLGKEAEYDGVQMKEGGSALSGEKLEEALKESVREAFEKGDK